MTVRLGWRLAVAGGHESLLRLAVMGMGVGIGVLFLLLSLTSQAAMQGRAERSGWQSADAEAPATAPDAALFLSVSDYHHGTVMIRSYVAALGPSPPVPPGLAHLPGPGEVAVSPAMRRLLASTPNDQLDDRYPGRVTSTIGDAGLAHPDQLVALIGRTPEQLREVRSASLHTVRGFDSLPSGYAFYVAFRVFLGVGAVLLLVPVAIFVVMATRVAAAHREQRLAAIRLVGATRPQTACVAAVETGIAAVAGSALGWAAYEVGRRALAATVTFQGAHFFTDDVVVAPWVLLLVLVGVPILATLTTIVALGRVQAGPLAAGRGLRRPPSPRRAWLLAVGFGSLLVAAPLRRSVGSEARASLDRLVPYFVTMTIVGFVVVGPWLCLLAGRGLARVSRRAPGLIAARRIANDPGATFRAVSVVVLAAFSVTYSASLVEASDDQPRDRGGGVLHQGVVEVLTGGVPEATVAPLLVEGAVAIRTDVGVARDYVESCRQLARLVTVPCSSSDAVSERVGLAGTAVPITGVYVPTDGTTAAEDRVRTRAADLVPNAIIHTRQDRIDPKAGLGSLGQLQRLGWHFVLIVAACSLTVGMLAGILERRRPLALLRASGLRLGELRQLVFLETAATMLVTAAASVGLGLAASYALALFVDMAWSWPDAGAFAIVGVGVLTALLLTSLALPLIDIATRHDTIRYE